MKSPVCPVALFSIARLIKKLRPDVLHTHSSVDSWLVSFCGRFLGVPIVRSRHVSIPVKNFFPRNWVYSSFPSRIITSGEAVSEMMTRLNGVTDDKVISISAGVDMARFDCDISGQPIRDELNLQPDELLIGKVGVIRGWKGYDFFLQAIPEVLKTFPQAQFVIVGDGPGYGQIRDKVAAMNLGHTIHVLGHREDIPQIMAAMDLLALASTAGEGTPQVIPQAFAMKTPVVATKVGAVPALLGDGARGILVEKESGSRLADGIIEMLQSPEKAKTLAENAYAYCQQELTFEKMMDRTLQVYYDVLNSHSAR